jgi:hypothetical protein
MEIITPGKLPEDDIHTTTCGSCGCHFRFKTAEAKRTSDQREGDYWTVKCPQQGCKYSVTIADPIIRRYRGTTSPTDH